MQSIITSRSLVAKLPGTKSSPAEKSPALLIALLAITMLVTANSWGVVETSEARYAEISREMMKSGDWLHPTLLNIYHYHKPPLTYWITASAYSVFGVNNFATRFFLTVAFCIQVFLIFRLSLLLFNNDNRIAYNSALVFATLPLVLISVRGLTTDAYLNLFVLATLYWSFLFLQNGKTRYVYFSTFSMALGFMTKGPVVFIIPLFAIAGFWKLFSKPRITLVQAGLAFGIFMITGLSWFVYLIAKDHAFLDYFLLHHFVDRIAHAEVFARKESWYYYLPLIPLVTIPAILMFIGGPFNRPAGDWSIARRILIWWFILPLVAFSISSSKLVLYILPLSIGFSTVTAYFLTANESKKILMLSAILIGLFYIGLIFIPHWLNFRTNFIITLIPCLSLFLSVGAISIKYLRKKIISIWLTLFALTLISFSSLFFRMNGIEVNTSRPISSFIMEKNMSQRNILVYDELLPSLAFELDKDIISLYANNRSLKRETQFETSEKWKDFLIDTSNKAASPRLSKLLSGKSVLVVKKELPQNMSAIMHGVWHKEELGKWLVYYN